MAIVLGYTVYSILIVLYESTAHGIHGRGTNDMKRLCSENAIAFVYREHGCYFDKEYAEQIIKDKKTTCQTKCDVEINGVNDKMYYTLRHVDITVDSYSYQYSPCADQNDNQNMLDMKIICPKWKTVKVPVGGYCMHDEQCKGSVNSGVCISGKCACRAGFVLFNLECHEGNLALNQSCSLSEQCAGSPYASCLGGKCSCFKGYTAMNSTDCVQKKSNIGPILGALFGGLILGVILTTVAVMIISRRSNKHVNKREELNVTFAEGESSAKIVDHSHNQNVQTKYKTREISPYSCSEEKSIHKPRNGQTQDDVYNHLHEQVKRDDADYYDHACTNSADIEDMSDYSHLRHVMS